MGRVRIQMNNRLGHNEPEPPTHPPTCVMELICALLTDQVGAHTAKTQANFWRRLPPSIAATMQKYSELAFTEDDAALVICLFLWEILTEFMRFANICPCEFLHVSLPM